MSVERKTPLAKKLTALRKRLGLTQVAVAELAGISRNAWVCWELDRRRPSTMALKLLRLRFPEESF